MDAVNSASKKLSHANKKRKGTKIFFDPPPGATCGAGRSVHEHTVRKKFDVWNRCNRVISSADGAHTSSPTNHEESDDAATNRVPSFHLTRAMREFLETRQCGLGHSDPEISMVEVHPLTTTGAGRVDKRCRIRVKLHHQAGRAGRRRGIRPLPAMTRAADRAGRTVSQRLQASVIAANAHRSRHTRHRVGTGPE